jgi:hypothetical protein
MRLSECEVRKLSADIRTSAVVVVRLLYINAPPHHHLASAGGAEIVSAPNGRR